MPFRYEPTSVLHAGTIVLIRLAVDYWSLRHVMAIHRAGVRVVSRGIKSSQLRHENRVAVAFISDWNQIR